MPVFCSDALPDRIVDHRSESMTSLEIEVHVNSKLDDGQIDVVLTDRWMNSFEWKKTDG